MKFIIIVFVALLPVHGMSLGAPEANERSEEPVKPVVIDSSTYRLGASNDGNDYDSDDLLDVALEIALCVEAGLKDKLTHIDYSNHLGKSKPGRVENHFDLTYL